MTKATAERRYVVWVENRKGRWMPSPAMPREQAAEYAETLKRDGKRTRVVQAPSFGVDDME